MFPEIAQHYFLLWQFVIFFYYELWRILFTLFKKRIQQVLGWCEASNACFFFFLKMKLTHLIENSLFAKIVFNCFVTFFDTLLDCKMNGNWFNKMHFAKQNQCCMVSNAGEWTFEKCATFAFYRVHWQSTIAFHSYQLLSHGFFSFRDIYRKLNLFLIFNFFFIM